ncbi:PREDICTED: DNA-directed primase/polymerase protein isoform X1 [Theobroma cacao]|uniref:DNA-directed primase/polymerase protein n=1 Tax=Theobroma cacao TaxID=3641 RepID=A0AB32W1X5_THECC|nr:PREDICTED: DNA-directed primase/polymerase protein isoform X1 [Theobroma cacao]
MAKKGNASTMDDVDRLFECFKCGISPPQSAVRERKRRKSKLNQENSARKVSASPCTPSLGSAEQGKETPNNAQLSVGKCVSTMVKVGKFSGGKRISPVIFYGSPHGIPPKRPLSLLRLLHEIRIELSEQEKFNLRTEVWATFPRQDEAVKFAKGHANALVFSYQDHYSGQRRYLASTYEEFWKRYKIMDSKLRHHYEVIQEGFPCHLYFDLEFNKRDNVGRDGDEMVDLLISVILEALLEKYSINGNQDWVVELDSSTEEKFSRHLIMRIPKTAFKDNSHVGAFVAEICSRIASARERDKRFETLYVKNASTSAESPGQLFVDTAVYSRNRCFRLALSSKAGKASFLLPTGRFKCKEMGEVDMFMASLICNMDVDCEKFLVCKMELDCVKTLHFETEVTSNFGRYCRAPQENTYISDVSTTYLTGKSPFPSLDEFIESIASTGNASGKIRSWYWFSEYGLIVYSMSRNRYCERIGREHKSNHVMYVVDMRRAAYYQKCYDPDCKAGYRSPLRPIPTDCIPDSSFFFDSRQIVDDDGLTSNDLEYQFVNNDNGRVLLYSNESDIDDCTKDSWWLEAVKVADNIDSKPERLMFNDMENMSDEDDDWWVAVERTASQAELKHLS